ncbi:MAG: NAD(P)H-dependent oxidoreductase [Candidatus Woesearchaeota archaeon]
MTLIIYAHPNKKGNNGLILEKVIKGLKAKKKKFDLIDLYDSKYRPVLEEKELYTQGNKFISKETLKYQEMISKTDHLIVIYPVWWNNMPAILKGFFEKVITPRFAFRYELYFGKLPVPIGLLKGKRASVFITTNSPKIIYWLVQKGRASSTIKKDILGFSGIKSKVFHYDNAIKYNKDKTRASKLVKKGLSWLYKK